jgi:hypothetical protein
LIDKCFGENKFSDTSGCPDLTVQYPSSSSKDDTIDLGSSSSNNGGTSSPSGGGNQSTYCTAGAKVITGCAAANESGAICFVKSGNIAGWNGSNTNGRSCKVNGTSGPSTVAGGSGVNWENQEAVTATSDGNAYIDCTAGDFSYFGISCW